MNLRDKFEKETKIIPLANISNAMKYIEWLEHQIETVVEQECNGYDNDGNPIRYHF
jgi:hypothetical protein